MGLLTLTPDQQAHFEKEYWDKRLKMDQDLAKQFEPIFKAREQTMRDELYREYSALPAGPLAQVPKPPAPAAPGTRDRQSGSEYADGPGAALEPGLEQQHGHVDQMADLVRSAAVKKIADEAMPVGRHGDEIDLVLAREFHDFIPRARPWPARDRPRSLRCGGTRRRSRDRRGRISFRRSRRG